MGGFSFNFILFLFHFHPTYYFFYSFYLSFLSFFRIVRMPSCIWKELLFLHPIPPIHAWIRRRIVSVYVSQWIPLRNSLPLNKMVLYISRRDNHNWFFLVPPSSISTNSSIFQDCNETCEPLAILTSSLYLLSVIFETRMKKKKKNKNANFPNIHSR